MQRLSLLSLPMRSSLISFHSSSSITRSLFSNIQRNFGHTPKQIPFEKWNIVRGDRVGVISGKDKGKQGNVVRVYRKSNKILVSGINQKLKKVKADQEKDQKGGLKAVIRPIHICKVMLVDPETGKTTRVRSGYLATGEKVRISKKSDTIIAKPVLSSFTPKNRNKNKVDGPKDTPPTKVAEVTYRGEDFDKIRQEFETYIQEKERKEKLLVFQD